jgi:RNA polymerase sigma-70 factor (ECF subfamily)
VSELRASEACDLSEAEAVRLAQQGDAAAFERLYRLHSRRVFALCLRILNNPAEAKHLTQETFLKVFRMIRTFRGGAAFATWLYRVTVNQVLMRMRKKTLSQASLEEIMESNEETGAVQAKLGGPDLRLAGLTDRLALERALDRLPPGFQATFVLHDVYGFQHREIGDILGCSFGNSKSQLHKARMRLRGLLRKGLRGAPRKQSPSSRRSPSLVRTPSFQPSQA